MRLVTIATLFSEWAIVKFMRLGQLFLRMLTLKALTQLNEINCYGSDLNVSMNQYH